MSNFSAYGTRRISLSVSVMLDKDLETISSRLRSYLPEDRRVLDSPSPSVTASNLTDKGVELLVQAWAKTEDADAVRTTLCARWPQYRPRLSRVRLSEPRTLLVSPASRLEPRAEMKQELKDTVANAPLALRLDPMLRDAFALDEMQ